jgi:putative redox protein
VSGAPDAATPPDATPPDAPAPDAAPPAPAAAGRPPSRVHVAWAGDRRFDAGRPGGPTLRLDGRGETGQTMVDAVLSALAACTAVDVVDILAKRRTPAEALEIDAVGERFAGTPGRLVRIHLTYRMRGAGVERAHVERAIDLAITKYCSVRDSLDPAIPIEWTLLLEGADG